MRLFIGIDVGKDIKDYCFNLVKQLNTKDIKVKWVAKKNLHLTLKFLGEIEDNKVDSIIELLKKIKFDKFSLCLKDLGVFPSSLSPKVIWAGFDKDSNLRELQNLLDGETLSYGVSEQVFNSHLTLGRVKSLRSKKEYVDFLEAVSVEKICFEVNEFVLYKSVLSKDGPKYFVVEKFSLD